MFLFPLMLLVVACDVTHRISVLSQKNLSNERKCWISGEVFLSLTGYRNFTGKSVSIVKAFIIRASLGFALHRYHYISKWTSWLTLDRLCRMKWGQNEAFSIHLCISFMSKSSFLNNLLDFWGLCQNWQLCVKKTEVVPVWIKKLFRKKVTFRISLCLDC